MLVLGSHRWWKIEIIMSLGGPEWEEPLLGGWQSV